MAPTKRRADLRDDDDSESSDNEAHLELPGASQSQLDAHRSKRRLSGHPLANESSDVSSDEDIVAHEWQPTQYDDLRDALDGATIGANEEDDDAVAAEAILSRGNGQLGDNRPAENGIIQSVEVINFMCHERLHVTLGPLINFIIGMNGSGKSAVLTAITLCLGAKASTTNRGGSLKSFIKEGREAASLIIKLKNGGEDAYQPHVYGESIIVERHFSRAGTSGFKLKSASGRVISTKRADVDDVIDYFQMQIDNPMSVLTQDAARQFLNSSTAAQKYKFFIKGVQLEQLDHDYRQVHQLQQNIEEKLTGLRENINALRKAREDAEAKKRAVENNRSMKDELRTLRGKYSWVQVRDQERELEQCNERLEAEVANIEAAQLAATEKADAYEQLNDMVERAGETVRSLEEDLLPLVEEETHAREKFDAASKEATTSHTMQRQIRDYLTAARAKREGYVKDIEAEVARIERATGGELAQLIQELERARQNVTAIQDEIVASAKKTPALEERSRAARETARQSQVPINSKQNEVDAAQRHLQSLQRDRGELMAGFDRAMPELLRLIHQDTGFAQTPVGPIGLHIKLLKPVWSNVLERSIGNLLTGFIVTNRADHTRLSGLMRRAKIGNCPIIISNNKPIDTRNMEPDEEHLTILRAVEIDNELVRRELIINQAIEQTLLIEKMDDAMRVMYDSRRPRNVKQCFCLNEQKPGWGIRLGYLRGGADQTTAPMRPAAGKPRMKTDVDSQITLQRTVVQHLQKEVSQLQKKKHDLEKQAEDHARAVEAHKREHKDLSLALQRAEEKVDRLEEENDRSNVEDGRLEALKEHLRQADDEIQLHENSYGDAGVEKEKHNALALTLRRQMQEVKTRVADQEAKITKAKKKGATYSQGRQVALVEKNTALDAVASATNRKQRAAEARDRQAGTVNEFSEMASRVSARVSVGDHETTDGIEARMKSLKAQLDAHARRVGGTDEEIKAAFVAARNAHEVAQRQLVSLTRLVKTLGDSLSRRMFHWHEFRKRISSRARMNFMYLLSERGFRGKLVLDHQQKLLDLHVEPDSTTASSKGRQTKTLSGGEKSFSSVCLLLSLWEAMAAPLRCLDEFDVFMDNVNRDISTNMIVTAARRSVGRQYILITPNGVGNVEHNKDVKVSK